MTGRRVVVDAFGETPPDALKNHVRIEPQPYPDVDRLQPTDIVVAVRAAAVGWVDLLMTSGQYQHMARPPYVPGIEFSGDVVWTGDGVTRVKVGDRVIADGFSTGPRSKGDYQGYGGFATWAVGPEWAAIPLPSTLSYARGSNFLGNYETAYHCLVHRGRLRAGETVLIHGASGATGLAAVHIAKRVGATIIATGRSAAKLEVVEANGADHVVRTVDDDGHARRFRDDVKQRTEGRGVDVVYDSVGGAISLETLRCVRFGARFLIVGWAATPYVAKGRGGRGAPNANQLPTNLIMMKGLDVLGCPTVISTHRDPGIRDERLSTLLKWAEAGDLTPIEVPSFPLEQVIEAMEAKWTSRYPGGCVLIP